jgi:pimeloyl-ACP methyl ester carboxylesterase
VSGARLLCAGTGKPPVVFEAPDGSAEHWRLVWPAVAAFAETCRHQRADGAAGFPRLAERAAELRGTLRAAAVPGPYVLVGHSLAGSVVRAYASSHPEEVAGLVLVDPMHEKLPARVEALLTPEQAAEYRRHGPPPEVVAAWREEARGFAPPGDVPLVVLTAGRPPPFPPDWPTEAIWRVWQEELVPDLVRLSARGEHQVAQDAGHMVPFDRPDAVVDAVRRVVEMAR